MVKGKARRDPIQPRGVVGRREHAGLHLGDGAGVELAKKSTDP